MEISNNHLDQKEELNNSQDIHRDYRYITQVRDDVSSSESTNDKNGVYTSTASNSVARLLEQPQKQDFKKEVNGDIKGILSSPDPSLTETIRFLKNLSEEYDEYQCNACQHKEAIWKNNTKPLICPKCKSKSLPNKED